ncbi:hypothetical protein [Pseudomonas chlororaphis]|uniref:hypothetical protein n=1 Tax=Pseudomonas chlororaphis TaxID=587753 RepID=UPI0012D2A186|nr:hypothetical protein [Pseudomonas chlororaphis]
MQKKILTAAAFLIICETCAADAYRDSTTPDKSGFMWGLLYLQAKKSCESLPQDLESDYAKSVKLLSDASPEFGPTYQAGLKPSLKKGPKFTAEELEADCNNYIVGMRNQVKLARYWFMGSW